MNCTRSSLNGDRDTSCLGLISELDDSSVVGEIEDDEDLLEEKAPFRACYLGVMTPDSQMSEAEESLPSSAVGTPSKFGGRVLRGGVATGAGGDEKGIDMEVMLSEVRTEKDEPVLSATAQGGIISQVEQSLRTLENTRQHTLSTPAKEGGRTAEELWCKDSPNRVFLQGSPAMKTNDTLGKLVTGKSYEITKRVRNTFCIRTYTRDCTGEYAQPSMVGTTPIHENTSPSSGHKGEQRRESHPSGGRRPGIAFQDQQTQQGQRGYFVVVHTV